MDDLNYHVLLEAPDEGSELAFDVMQRVMAEHGYEYEGVKTALRGLVRDGHVRVVRPGVGRRKSWLSAAEVARTPAGYGVMRAEFDARTEWHETFEKRMKGRSAIRLRGVDVPEDVRKAVEAGEAELVVKLKTKGV